MNQHEHGTKNAAAFLAGALAGAAVGAIAGLLLAPRSGRESREQIGDWAEEWTDRAREAAETAFNRARGTVHNGQDLAEHEIQAAKAAWKAGRDAWKEAHPDSAAA